MIIGTLLQIKFGIKGEIREMIINILHFIVEHIYNLSIN